MAIVKMNKFSLIALNNDKGQILENLMEIGVTEIVNIEEELTSEEFPQLVEKDGDKETVSEIEEHMDKISFVLESLSKHDARKKGLFEARRLLDREGLERVIDDKDRLLSVIHQVLKLNEKLGSLKSEKNRSANLIASLEPWKSLDIPLEADSTEKSTITTGVIPAAADAEELERELDETIGHSFLTVIGADSDQTYLLLVYYTPAEAEVWEVLKRYGFSKVAFKDMTGTAGENIQRAESTIAETDRSIAEGEAAIAAFSSEIANLEVLYDYFLIQRDRHSALQSMVRTEKAFMLQGWIPAELGDKVKKDLEDKWNCIIQITEPEGDEEFPILLTNRDLGRSVESVTRMYSLPDHREMDPNAIMGPFFVLFFGLMLGDAGYGLIMVLLSGIALWKLRLEDSMRRFMKLMLYCGFSTAFWGAMFGGWFGIASLGEFPIWFNPVEDPEELLKWSLCFGVIHIYVGLGMKALNLIRDKKYLDAVLDVFLWYIFFTGFVLFVLPFVPKINADEVTGLVQLGKNLLIVGGVLLILTQGREHKNIVMKLFGGLAKLYDLVAFMSDVLSYSRLLALGLATSVIASIINQMAAMNGLDSIFKILVFVVVVLAGHTFNFAINALGAYVHSSRLQYIEFFGKFYKGGGTPFEPLKINTKYIILKN